MNPIFQAMIHTILRRKRTCRKCKRYQIVPASKGLKFRKSDDDDALQKRKRRSFLSKLFNFD